MAGVCLLAVLGLAQAAQAREEWFRGLDLETPAARADLILAVRVADVSDTKVIFGGKAETSLQQFKFEPVRTLKGVFARDVLSLTSSDLGGLEGLTRLERGQMRLLFLGRSGSGYASVSQQATLDQSLPPLRDDKDPLLAAVEVLIAVTEQQDRARKVALLLDGLRKARGPDSVPLLSALQRRALVAAQSPGTAAVLSTHLAGGAPAVREAAARALAAVLTADYLDQRELRRQAAAALGAALDKAGPEWTTRVAALEALGAAGQAAVEDKTAARQLELVKPRRTLAEQAALLGVIGRLKMTAQRPALVTLLEQLPLDAPYEVQWAAEDALARMDPEQAVQVVTGLVRQKYDAGLGVQTEIQLLGQLPAAVAVPPLLEVVRLSLDHAEKITFASACLKLADPRLVPVLAGMLDPRQPDLRWEAVEALRKIDTDDAAKALLPHLREEADLFRKLQMAKFLGKHGFRDGYPYAIEHLSEPYLLEQAVAALAAIHEPKSIPVLRRILKTSHDVTWNGAAIRALGALGERDVAPQFVEIVQDLKRPLAPYALIALGDLGEVKALPRVREGLLSRNSRVVLASIRAAGKLLAAADGTADDIRDQLAALLTDADAAQELRAAALEALVKLKDKRLDRVLPVLVRDGGLEGSNLLERAEQLVRERKVELKLA